MPKPTFRLLEEPARKSGAGPRLPARRGRVAVGQAALNRRALFVIVPGGDQQEGHGMLGGVLAGQFRGVGKSLAAALRDVPVQAPGSFAVVKARPGRS